MSLTIDGVWKAGVWATTVWANGVWREGAYVPPPAPEVTGGAVSRKKRKRVVVEIEGKQYRVLLENLPSFLAAQKKAIEIPKKVEKILEKVLTVEKLPEAPVIKIKYAPEEDKQHIQAMIDRQNDIFKEIWRKVIIKKMMERDEEECLLCLM